MSDEKWLRDGLADAVPEPPANPDRARAAEGLARRRRRTTALAVAGTAGAVAAAAVLTASLASGGDDRSRPDRDVADDPSVVVECPPAPVEGETDPVDEPDPDGPDAVPEGATSARLCQGSGMRFAVPTDALVTGVEALVDTVNNLQETGSPEMCTLELGRGFRIAFGYDDGSRFVVSGRLYGCQTLVVGSGYRTDPKAAEVEFLSLLRAQRDATEPPDEPAAGPVECPGGPTYDHDGIDDVQDGLPDAVPEGATSVRLCAGGGNPGVEPLDALTTDVATLVDVVNGLPGQASEACTHELGPGYRLAFGYPDGSRFVVVGRFDGCDNVVVGSDYRDDPQVPLDAFVDLLRAQRGGQSPPRGTGGSKPSCNLYGHPTEAMADPTETVAAQLCIGRRAIEIPADALPTLIDDIRANQDTSTTGACRAQPTKIVGVTRWGDEFSLNSECGTDSYQLPGAGSRFWNTSPEIEQLLEDLASAD